MSRAPGAGRRPIALRSIALLLVATSAIAGARSARAAPVTVVDDRGREHAFEHAPQRIVSMLPSLTETVCALRACDRLVGVDRASNWPPQAASLPRVGGLEDTSIERVVALRPDLVLAPRSSRAIDRLESLGVRVLALEPQGLADTRRVLRTVAVVLGRAGDGETLWAAIDARIAAAAARLPAPLRGARTYVEVSEAPHAAGEASFVGETLARLGLVNIVPASLGPFPQLNPEFVVRADPQLAIASERAAASMPARPGWSAIAALRDARVCALPPAQWDLLVRPGPRLGEAAEAVVDCLAAIDTRAPRSARTPR